MKTPERKTVNLWIVALAVALDSIGQSGNRRRQTQHPVHYGR